MEILNTVSKQVYVSQDRIHGMISAFIKADWLTSIIQRQKSFTVLFYRDGDDNDDNNDKMGMQCAFHSCMILKQQSKKKDLRYLCPQIVHLFLHFFKHSFRVILALHVCSSLSKFKFQSNRHQGTSVALFLVLKMMTILQIALLCHLFSSASLL